MRYTVTHKTLYNYPKPVSQAINLAYLLPRNTHRQTCESRKIEILPDATTRLDRVDYFGNQAVHFTVEKPHTSFSVIATSDVITGPADILPEPGSSNTCRQARELLDASQDPNDLLVREFRLGSPLIETNDPFAQFAAPFFADDDPFLDAVSKFNQHIYKEFTFDPHFSDVSTPLEDVLSHRKGVCQDFAQLAIACLRSLGFPARYMSGYLETLPPPGQKKLVGSDASHAWFAVFSPGEGWFEFDPTNNLIPGEQHVVTAWGRDYSDVTPLRGVVMGGGSKQTLKVSVDVMRR